MEIGVSTASLFMRAYNEDIVQILDGLDARVIEVFLESFSEYENSYANLLKSRMGNLKVHSLHVVTMSYETELFSKNERAFDDNRKIFETTLSSGQILGADCYTMHGKARIRNSPIYDDFEFLTDRFNLLCDIANNYGIKICLENVAWAYYNRPDYFRYIKANNLFATLDVKQARISGYSAQDYIEDMQGKIKTVHLSDVDDMGKIRLPSFGNYDFESLFKSLKDNGFDGDMLIEVYKDDYKDYSEIKRSLEYLRELKYKIF